MHPVLRIVALISLAMGVQFLQAPALALWTLLLGSTCLLKYGDLFKHLLLRSRWLLLTLLAIFSFTTPGEYVRGWPLQLAPTYEGALAGALQLARLVVMLAGLTLLLGSTSREALVSSIHFLMRPLRLIGLSPERFSARLWLTLHYVEQSPSGRGTKWELLSGLANGDAVEDGQHIALMLPLFTWRDALVIMAATAGMGWWML